MITVIKRPKHPANSYVILDCPTDKTLDAYLPTIEEQKVKHLVRISDENYAYDTRPLQELGVTVHDDMRFQDGTAPSQQVVERWLKVVGETFPEGASKQDAIDANAAVAVHCVSGIGRAPVLVGIALVELDNLDPMEAVDLIRKHRRGALNAQQLKWLCSYKRQKNRIKPATGNGKQKKKHSFSGFCGCGSSRDV